jgi:hypothetical protein
MASSRNPVKIRARIGRMALAVKTIPEDERGKIIEARLPSSSGRRAGSSSRPWTPSRASSQRSVQPAESHGGMGSPANADLAAGASGSW